MLISILGIIFSNLDIPLVDAGKKSFKSKSKKSKSDFKKPSKKSKSDFKQYDKKIKQKKFKPSSISQGSSLPSFKPANINSLDKDKLRNLDKDKLDKFPGISQLPNFPECGKQGNCIDIGGGVDIDDGIDIDGDVNVDWDNDWDINWDDVDVDIDDDIDVDIDDDDIDITVEDDDDDDDHDHDDDEEITYIYNYGYPESSYQESYAYEDGMFPIQEETTPQQSYTTPQQSYVTSEVQRIVNEGSFKLHLVESGISFTPVNNSGYVLLGANQGKNNELEISNGSNGQLIILTGADDSRPIKISSIGNIKLDLNEAILGKNDALILTYLDQSTSWVQIASKFV